MYRRGWMDGASGKWLDKEFAANQFYQEGHSEGVNSFNFAMMKAKDRFNFPISLPSEDGEHFVVGSQGRKGGRGRE